MPAVPALPWAVWGETDFAVALSRDIFLGWWGKNPRVIPKRGDGLYKGLCNSACDFLPKKSHFLVPAQHQGGGGTESWLPRGDLAGERPQGKVQPGLEESEQREAQQSISGNPSSHSRRGRAKEQGPALPSTGRGTLPPSPTLLFKNGSFSSFMSKDKKKKTS